MLGRLGMTVDECIKAYKEVAQQAFTPKRNFPLALPARPSGAFSATQLQAAIKRTVREYCGDAECVEERRRTGSTSETCQHEEMPFRNGQCIKTYVFWARKGNSQVIDI